MTLTTRPRNRKPISPQLAAVLEYFGVNPHSRADRMTFYGEVLGRFALASSAVGLGYLFLRTVSLTW